MNIDIKTLNKILARQIQPYMKRIIHQETLELLQGCKYILTHRISMSYTMRTKGKTKTMVISKDAEAFDKIQYSFMIKTLTKLGVYGIYLNIIKAIYNKPILNIILNSEKLKAFLLNSGI